MVKEEQNFAFVDTHCHLNFEQFHEDRDAVVQRALDVNVRVIINPAVNVATSQQAIDMTRIYASVYAQVGIHPNSAQEVTPATIRDMRVWAQTPKVVAIGEVGLDYHWNVHPREVQMRSFRSQLELAAELGLPAVIHSRDAQTDTYTLLSDWLREVRRSHLPLNDRPFPAVWHSFQGDQDLAYRVFDLGMCISLGGPVTFKNARDLRALVPQLPLERILLETDAPFLSPHPYRGKRNEPARIPLIAAAIAQLQGRSLEQVARTTTATAQAVFGKLVQRKVLT